MAGCLDVSFAAKDSTGCALLHPTPVAPWFPGRLKVSVQYSIVAVCVHRCVDIGSVCVFTLSVLREYQEEANTQPDMCV